MVDTGMFAPAKNTLLAITFARMDRIASSSHVSEKDDLQFVCLKYMGDVLIFWIPLSMILRDVMTQDCLPPWRHRHILCASVRCLQYVGVPYKLEMAEPSSC
jgi:hypothetical protein